MTHQSHQQHIQEVEEKKVKEQQMELIYFPYLFSHIFGTLSMHNFIRFYTIIKLFNKLKPFFISNKCFYFNFIYFFHCLNSTLQPTHIQNVLHTPTYTFLQLFQKIKFTDFHFHYNLLSLYFQPNRTKDAFIK